LERHTEDVTSFVLWRVLLVAAVFAGRLQGLPILFWIIIILVYGPCW
jgi:hypothetical protein